MTSVRSNTVMLAAAGVALAASGCPEPEPPLCTDEAASGEVCVVAGNHEPSFGGDGERADMAGLYEPTDVAARTGTGELFIADWNNHKIRRVLADGTITTDVGTDLPGDGDPDDADRTDAGAPGTTVGLNHPVQVEWAPEAGVLLMPNWHNHRIRTLDPDTGIVKVEAATTYQGNGADAGFGGDGGPADVAIMAFPISIAIGDDGYYMIAQGNLRIRRIATDWSLIQTVAGSGTAGYEGDGGDPLLATFRFPPAGLGDPGGAVEVGSDGLIYLVDTANHCIRVIDLDAGMIDTLAGNGEAGYADGNFAEARFNAPRDIEEGPDGRLYIADTMNHVVRAIDLVNATVETVAGTGAAGDGEDRLAPLDTALDSPYGIEFGDDGELLIADTRNNVIRRVTP